VVVDNAADPQVENQVRQFNRSGSVIAAPKNRKPLARYSAIEGALARGLLHISTRQGVSSSCRPGVDSGCRLTTRLRGWGGRTRTQKCRRKISL
jgi:hypothetical protein